VGLVVMLLVTFTFTSNFFDQGYQNTYVVAASKTPAGYVPAGSTDATRRAVGTATQSAVIHLTENPPTLENRLRAGDHFYEDGLYRYALEQYNIALDMQRTAEIYMKRGRTYWALGQEVEAQEDFADAIQIDPDYAPAYVERGLMLVSLWRETQNVDYANWAREDLLKARSLGGASKAAQDALKSLP